MRHRLAGSPQHARRRRFNPVPKRRGAGRAVEAHADFAVDCGPAPERGRRCGSHFKFLSQLKLGVLRLVLCLSSVRLGVRTFTLGIGISMDCARLAEPGVSSFGLGLLPGGCGGCERFAWLIYWPCGGGGGQASGSRAPAPPAACRSEEVLRRRAEARRQGGGGDPPPARRAKGEGEAQAETSAAEPCERREPALRRLPHPSRPSGARSLFWPAAVIRSAGERSEPEGGTGGPPPAGVHRRMPVRSPRLSRSESIFVPSRRRGPEGISMDIDEAPPSVRRCLARMRLRLAALAPAPDLEGISTCRLEDGISAPGGIPKRRQKSAEQMKRRSRAPRARGYPTDPRPGRGGRGGDRRSASKSAQICDVC